MNEEDNSSTPSNLHTWIDPEMEARIVALILGEASDFEREELERIIADNPEMRTFRRRIEEIHNALAGLKNGSDAGNTEEDWKLGDEKRDALNAVFAFEATDGKAKAAEGILEGEKRSPWKIIPIRNWRQISKIAAVVGVLLSVGAIVIISSISSFQSEMDFATAEKSEAWTAPPSVKSAAPGDEMALYSIDAEPDRNPEPKGPTWASQPGAIGYDDENSARESAEAQFEMADNSVFDRTESPRSDSDVFFGSHLTEAGKIGDRYRYSEPSPDSIDLSRSKRENLTRSKNSSERLLFAEPGKDRGQEWKEEKPAISAEEGVDVDPFAAGGEIAHNESPQGAKQPAATPTMPAEPATRMPSPPVVNGPVDELKSEIADKEGEFGDESVLNEKELLASVDGKPSSDDDFGVFTGNKNLSGLNNRLKENGEGKEEDRKDERNLLAKTAEDSGGASNNKFDKDSRGWFGREADGDSYKSAVETELKYHSENSLSLLEAEQPSEQAAVSKEERREKKQVAEVMNKLADSSFPVTPATPTNFESPDAGGTLEVDPARNTPTPGIEMPAIVTSKRLPELSYESDFDRDSDGLANGIVTDSRDFLDVAKRGTIENSKTDSEKNASHYWQFDSVPELGDVPVTGGLFRQNTAEKKFKANKRPEESKGREANHRQILLSSEALDVVSGKFDPSGSPAVVEATRKFISPTEYDAAELPASGGTVALPFKVPAFPTTPAAAGLDEKTAAAEPFSTFSLNVSDVSFKLAKASLDKGEWPEADKIRIEEFVNAFDYGDPLPSQDDKVACRVEQAVHPFLQQRNLVRIAMRTGAAGRAAETPLKLTFLLDNSGSMERADRQATVRRAFAELAAQLKPNDQVTLISFARQPRLLADKVGGEQANDLITAVKNMPSEGGTNLEAALNLAFEKAKELQADGAQNRIILLTDGAANLGDADPETLSKKIETFREAGIAFDAAGIVADGLNDETLEALTRKGDGRYYLLDSPEDADSGFAEKIAGALRPSAKNVKVQVEFNPERVGSYKLLGFEKHRLNKEDFRNDAVDAAEMAAEETGVAVYQIEALPQGTGDIGSVSVRFRDLSSDAMVEKRWPISYAASSPQPDQASASMRLASAASMFAAKLKGGPLGATVDLEAVAKLITGLPEPYSKMERVTELQTMVAKARELEGR